MRPVSGLARVARTSVTLNPDDAGDRLPVSTVAVETVADDHPASLTVAGAVPDFDRLPV